MIRIGRRTLIRSGLRAGVGLSLTITTAEGQVTRASARPARGDLLVRAGGQGKKPLTVGDVRLSASPIFAWPMDPRDGTVRSESRLNQVLLVGLDVQTLSPRTRPWAVNGVVAYTAICTHTGCAVADWIRDEQALYCSCHGSKFDPRDGAKVLEGQAPRPLPALPLKAVRGRLVVAAPFTTPVGFESA